MLAQGSPTGATIPISQRNIRAVVRAAYERHPVRMHSETANRVKMSFQLLQRIPAPHFGNARGKAYRWTKTSRSEQARNLRQVSRRVSSRYQQLMESGLSPLFFLSLRRNVEEPTVTEAQTPACPTACNDIAMHRRVTSRQPHTLNSGCWRYL